MNLSNILWIDLETSGLDYDTDEILEVAVIVTNSKLQIISESFESVVYNDGANMSEWCRVQHTKSGLLKECLESNTDITQVEDLIMQMIYKYFPENNIVIAGSSVHFDRNFIRRYMPRVYNLLSHRIIDVSSFTEIITRMYPWKTNKCSESRHRALNDILSSICLMVDYANTYICK
jgi:oligoribonuclease